MREIHKSNNDKRLERENIKLIGQIQGYEDSRPEHGPRKHTRNLSGQPRIMAAEESVITAARTNLVIRDADSGIPALKGGTERRSNARSKELSGGSLEDNWR